MSHFVPAVLLSLLTMAAPAHDKGAAAVYRASYQLEAKGDFGGALANMETLSRAGDASYFLTVRMAWLRYRTGDWVGAEHSYRQAISAKPKAVEPKLGLTLVLLAVENWKALDEACRSALELAPSDADLRARLAAAQYNLGRYPDAAVLYRKLIEEYPAVLAYQTGYAWAVLRMGRRKEARAIFAAVLAVSPDNVYAQEGLKDR
jgi:tetratricopeptide (TPR) repeat protein